MTSARIASAWEAAFSSFDHWSAIVRWDGEELFARDPRGLYSSASMIKTFLAVLLCEDLAQGRCRADDHVRVCARHLAEGDGVIRLLRLPRTFRLDELVTLMLSVSDNTATNSLIDRLGGVNAINARLVVAGLRSRLFAPVGSGDSHLAELSQIPSSRPSQRGIGQIDAFEHAQAVDRLLEVPMFADALFGQRDRLSLARHLCEEALFAHKTGTAYGTRHDGGVLCVDGHRLSVTCLTDGGPADEYADHPACVAMGDAMRETMRILGLDGQAHAAGASQAELCQLFGYTMPPAPKLGDMGDRLRTIMEALPPLL